MVRHKHTYNSSSRQLLQQVPAAQAELGAAAGDNSSWVMWGAMGKEGSQHIAGMGSLSNVSSTSIAQICLTVTDLGGLVSSHASHLS